MSLSANELRIGNYVSNYNWVQPLKVVAIKEDGVVWLDGTGVGYLNTPSFDGIPLTEDWLVRFGFQKPVNDLVVEYKLNGIELCYITTDQYYQFCFGAGISIKSGLNEGLTTLMYVHQLQNLYFALTGQELELTTPFKADKK